MHQRTIAVGKTVEIHPAHGKPEVQEFASEAEATARAAFVTEALSWIGTPFVNCAAVKGPAGAVDCAMLLSRCAVESGLLPEFDPRPYPPHWHMHRDEQRFLGWVSETFGCEEIAEPRIGDIAVFQFGRCFSHGAVLINSAELVHAYAAERMVNATRRDTPLLEFIGWEGRSIPRPVKYFDPYKGRV